MNLQKLVYNRSNGAVFCQNDIKLVLILILFVYLRIWI